MLVVGLRRAGPLVCSTPWALTKRPAIDLVDICCSRELRQRASLCCMPTKGGSSPLTHAARWPCQVELSSVEVVDSNRVVLYEGRKEGAVCSERHCVG
jgi:hypothetical protein